MELKGKHSFAKGQIWIVVGEVQDQTTVQVMLDSVALGDNCLLYNLTLPTNREG